jgi:hypothetical protein
MISFLVIIAQFGFAGSLSFGDGGADASSSLEHIRQKNNRLSGSCQLSDGRPILPVKETDRDVLGMCW